MANIQERIANLGKMFAGFNIGNDSTGKQFIYLELVFPKGWGITNLIKDKFGVNVVKNDAGNGYYFWCGIENGFDAVFDAAEFNIKANEEAQEKKVFLDQKIKELQQLVLEEDMAVLKTLEFKVKRKKITNSPLPKPPQPPQKKEPEVTEQEEAEIAMVTDGEE